MDKILDVPIFLEFYGKLLSDRQAEIISLFCDEDYSLTEIAENLQISRQAVYDSIKNGTAALEGFEEKIGLVKRYKLRKKIGENLIDMIKSEGAAGGESIVGEVRVQGAAEDENYVDVNKSRGAAEGDVMENDHIVRFQITDEKLEYMINSIKELIEL